MPLYATNTAGPYGVPGLGTIKKDQTVQVTSSQAAWLRGLPEFKVTSNGSLDDLPFKTDGVVTHIGYSGTVDRSFGYGTGGETILHALTLAGIEAAVNPVYYALRPKYVKPHPDAHPAVRAQLNARKYIPKWEIVQALPDALLTGSLSHRVCWTMWESDRIPDGTNTSVPFGDWATLINTHTKALIVPCEHNKEVFARCGVTVPITVINYGLDADQWPYYERRGRDPNWPFTFVQFGDLTTRKGVFEAYQGFRTAFPDNSNVRLVLKSQLGHFGNGTTIPLFSDKRVTCIDAHWDHATLLQFLHDADAFIFPTRGEGFGLPPLQALLTGLPVIIPNHTGVSEWYDRRYCYGLDIAGTSPAPLYGNWFDPDVESIALVMRAVYHNRSEALRRGRTGAAYIRKKFTMARMASELAAFLNELQ